MADPVRILLLEDDPNLGLIVQESLQKKGFSVELVRDGQAGLDALTKAPFHLCLVDVMMPILDGFSFAPQARRLSPDIPLIFLTARSLVEDRIEGFRLGCDDYVTKPFSMEELLLRIEAVLRRAGGRIDAGELPEVVALGRYQYRPRDRTLSCGADARRLTDREADLLELLYRHRNRTLERSAALLAIWGDDSYHCGRSMDVFVSKLRKYLADDPEVEIRTVHGQGLRFLLPED